MTARIEPEELVMGDGWLIAHYPQVECAYFGNNVDDQSFDAYIEQITRDVERREGKIGVLYYAQDADFDSPRRRRMAKFLDEYKQKLTETTAAFALATTSPFTRGILTTLLWLSPPGYPYKVAATPAQGLGFIRQHLPGIEVEAIAASFLHLVETELRKAS